MPKDTHIRHGHIALANDYANFAHCDLSLLPEKILYAPSYVRVLDHLSRWPDDYVSVRKLQAEAIMVRNGRELLCGQR